MFFLRKNLYFWLQKGSFWGKTFFLEGKCSFSEKTFFPTRAQKTFISEKKPLFLRKNLYFSEKTFISQEKPLFLRMNIFLETWESFILYILSLYSRNRSGSSKGIKYRGWLAAGGGLARQPLKELPL